MVCSIRNVAGAGVSTFLSASCTRKVIVVRRRAILLLVVMATALVVASGVALAAKVKCPNKAGNRCVGTNARDVMTGKTRPDQMFGRGGNDALRAQAGNDRLIGGPGNDVLLGATGNDVLVGQIGNDVLNGGAGNDIMYGYTGPDTIYGSLGNDIINVTSGDPGDRVDCGPNWDTVYVDRMPTGERQVIDSHANCENVIVTPAISSDHGASFAVRCDFSHRNSDDPVVHPGEQGAAHSHDFFGNETTNADSTYESMSAPGTETTCTRPEDTAGYWIPTVSWSGQEKQANRAVFYYRAGDKDHTQVKPFARDLRVIADKNINGSRISWYCGADDNKDGSPDPPAQCPGGVLGLRIIFPDCVAEESPGVQKIDSTDHRSHMTRSVMRDGTRRCPGSHPIPVPTLTLNANFEIPTAPGQVTLSSGAASTMHSDFWNTWDQGTLEELVLGCINGVPPSQPRPVACQAPSAQ
jgi:Domain of unknown function (DUF1996)/RTX calcium-binding nonapeptide repeat (4 copies)